MIDHDRLRELLRYDPVTGVFTWRVDRMRGRGVGNVVAQAGSVAGSPCNGYRYIQIDGRKYRAGRLAFLYMTGAWPKNMVDHRDLDPSNDRWENLRDATRSQNGANTKGLATVGLKGVTKRGSAYRAQICRDGEVIHLGTFGDPVTAHAVYMTAARDLHGEFARAS